MKEMTKEELIEYFLELLNKNNLLENIMTNEQIKEKLNYLIKDVTYNSEIGNVCASWRTLDREGKGIANFDLSKNFGNAQKVNIVHELLHALSTTTIVLEDNGIITRTKVKCGLRISEKMYVNQQESFTDIFNTAINEGLTDFLAEQISGVKNYGYNTEKDIYRVISVIIGQESILKKAFTDNVSINQEPLELFKEDLIEKYGEDFGAELNEYIKKIFILSDDLLNLNINDNIYGLNENGKRIQAKTKVEIYDALYSMIEKVIENEPEVMKKIDIMIDLEKNCDFLNTDLTKIREMVSKNALCELLNDDSMDFTKKLETIKRIKHQKINISGVVLDEIFNEEGLSKFSIDEKFEIYLSMYEGKELYSARFNKIYQMYVESGIIIEEKFSKKEFFKLALGVDDFNICGPVINAKDIMDESFEDCFYYKVGEYYAVSKMNNQKETALFDLNGEPLKTRKLNFNASSEKLDYFDNKFVSKKFGEDRTQTICEQLKEKFNEYKSKAKSNGIYYDSSVTSFGGILRVNFQYYIEQDDDEIEMCYVDFYSVNDDGTLELIPKSGEKRRIIDDMSEIDNELQKQTADVSIIEMMQEADRLKVGLSSKETRMEENSIGEGINGK